MPPGPTCLENAPAPEANTAPVYATAIEAEAPGPQSTLYVAALKSLHKRVRGCFTGELGLAVARNADEATLGEYGWRAAVSCLRLMVVQGVATSSVNAVRALLEYARITATRDARRYQEVLWRAVEGMHCPALSIKVLPFPRT